MGRSMGTPLQVGIRAAIHLGGALLLAFAGCTPSFPQTPVRPSAQFAPSEAPPGMDDVGPQGLRLYPGDTLELRLASAEAEVVSSLVIDDRGMVRVPLAGDVPIGGLPVGEAEALVETQLQRFDRAVRVSLVIATPGGHLVTVLGAVTTPGRYEVTPGMRVADLLAVAGGVAASDEVQADLAGARVVRDGRALPISLTLAMSGDPRHNVRILPGDSLYMPLAPGQRVTVLGQVGASSMIPFWSGMRLTQALAVAGGVTRDGNWGDVRVIRGDAEEPSVYRTSVSDLVDGRTHDVILAPGDIVYVASAGHADLRDVMTSVSILLSLPVTAASITVPSLLLGGSR